MTQQHAPRVLIYKRTHTGDPTHEGVFGINDCLGSIRAREFDAVIGIGGISREPRSYGIDGRLNWVGVGAYRLEKMPLGHRGPLIKFDRFLLLDDKGPKLDHIAPALAQYLFGINRRSVMSDGLGDRLLEEIGRILKLAERGVRDPARTVPADPGICRPKCRPKKTASIFLGTPSLKIIRSRGGGSAGRSMSAMQHQEHDSEPWTIGDQHQRATTALALSNWAGASRADRAA